MTTVYHQDLRGERGGKRGKIGEKRKRKLSDYEDLLCVHKHAKGTLQIMKTHMTSCTLSIINVNTYITGISYEKQCFMRNSILSETIN